MTKMYQAKISHGLLIFTSLIIFIPFLLDIKKNGIENGFYVKVGFIIFIYAFVLHIFLKTSYTVENKILKIKCGFLFKKNIPIETIKTIKKTKSLMSSPAPSFDRVEIIYGKFDAVIISPKDKIGFTNDLTATNPNIINDLGEN